MSLSGPQSFLVTGLPKSGTTWFMRLLNCIDGVRCTGEGRFFASGLRDVPSLWDGLAEGIGPWYRYVALRKGSGVGADGDIATVNRRNFLPEGVLVEGTDRMVAALAGQVVRSCLAAGTRELAGVRAVGDKTPVTRPVELRRASKALPEAKLLVLRRDVNDFVVSYLFHYWRAMRDARPDRNMDHVGVDDFLHIERYMQGHNLAGAGLASPETCARLAGVWCEVRTEIGRLSRQTPDLVLVVDYERLWADPAQELARTLQFLQIEYSAAAVQKAVDATSIDAVERSSDNALKNHVRRGRPWDHRRHLGREAVEAIAGTLRAAGFGDGKMESGGLV